MGNQATQCPLPPQVALIEQRVRPHGGMDRRLLAVVLHEGVSAAVDVQVGGCHGKLTPNNAATPLIVS